MNLKHIYLAFLVTPLLGMQQIDRDAQRKYLENRILVFEAKDRNGQTVTFGASNTPPFCNYIVATAWSMAIKYIGTYRSAHINENIISILTSCEFIQWRRNVAKNPATDADALTEAYRLDIPNVLAVSTDKTLYLAHDNFKTPAAVKIARTSGNEIIKTVSLEKGYYVCDGDSGFFDPFSMQAAVKITNGETTRWIIISIKDDIAVKINTAETLVFCDDGCTLKDSKGNTYCASTGVQF